MQNYFTSGLDVMSTWSEWTIFIKLTIFELKVRENPISSFKFLPNKSCKMVSFECAFYWNDSNSIQEKTIRFMIITVKISYREFRLGKT